MPSLENRAPRMASGVGSTLPVARQEATGDGPSMSMRRMSSIQPAGSRAPLRGRQNLVQTTSQAQEILMFSSGKGSSKMMTMIGLPTMMITAPTLGEMLLLNHTSDVLT